MSWQQIFVSIMAAASIGVFHTIIGPDHYLPFVALGRSRGWGTAKTLLATLLCGGGHVLSSLAVGVAGIVLGAGLGEAASWDDTRADIVKWIFFIFSAFYMIYGIWRGIGGDADGHKRHSVAHDASFWVLFAVFIFGPCEILIPLIAYPAAHFDWFGVISVALSFSAATIATMLIIVYFMYRGMSKLPFSAPDLERWNHAITGAVLLFCSLFLFFEA